MSALLRRRPDEHLHHFFAALGQSLRVEFDIGHLSAELADPHLPSEHLNAERMWGGRDSLAGPRW
jgi:hypothetical protein